MQKKYTYLEIRSMANLSLVKMAEKIKLTKANYYRIETYKAIPKITTFYKYYDTILKPLHLTIEDIKIK